MPFKVQFPKTVGEPRWSQERRLEFIDFRLRWNRTVNRGELVDFFRISIQQASADLAYYSQLAPNNMEYDKSLKTYKATSNFQPAINNDDAHSYLSELLGLSVGTLDSSASFIGWQPPHDLVHYPTRPIETGILLRLLWAIKDEDELLVSYQSMRRPKPTTRWIAPHALAFDGQRWHVRAWCQENKDFRDFVISRIQHVDASRKSTVSAEADSWWNTYVDIVIKPRNGLTSDQRRAIEIDFGMTRSRLRLSCRKALAFYLLRQLQLDRPLSLPPAVQPLELVNRDNLTDVIVTAQKTPTFLSVSHTQKSER